MVKKRSPLEPSIKRRRSYTWGGFPTPYSQDPLTKIENQALSDLSNEYRTLRIEEMITKKKRQLEKSSPSSELSMQKQNLDIVGSIVKIAKEISPTSGTDQTLEYLKFFNTVIQNQGGKGPSFFENMISDPLLYQRTQDIFSRGRTGETNKSDIEIERLRSERNMNNRKYDLELHKLRLETELRQNNLGLIAQILGPILAVGGNQIAQTMRNSGMELGQRARDPGNPASQNAYQKFLQEAGIVTPGALSGDTAKLQFNCSCGFNEALLVPMPPPLSLSCPNCGQQLLTGPPAIGDAEVSEQWKDQR